MSRPFAWCWCGLTGCTRPAVREKPIADPLLTSKKPVEGKAGLSDGRSLPPEQMILPPPPPPTEAAPPRDTIVRMLGVQGAQTSDQR